MLGPSVRVVAPVHDPGRGNRITALVSSGITIKTISAQLRDQVLALVGVAAAALALGGLGTYVINARLRRHTHGMNAGELSRMHDYHQAALHAVREGLLMLDGRRRVALINDGGRELLGLSDDAVGRQVTELGLPEPLTEALLAPGPRVDELQLTSERVLVVNSAPVSGGERCGSVVTLRDHTELQALSGELDSVRGVTEALRSQAHEAANRLHTVVSLIELGRAEAAVEFATAELELAQALTDQVVGAVAEPVLAALLLGKAAQANERGVELTLTPDSRIDDGLLPPGLPARDLVTVLGNLVDNAIDAAAPTPERGAIEPRVRVTARAAAGELLLRVADTGPGVAADAAEEIFRRGWTTKPGTAAPAQGAVWAWPWSSRRYAATAARSPWTGHRRAARGSPYGCRCCGRGRRDERGAARRGPAGRERVGPVIPSDIRVLVVEDDPVAAGAHALYVGRVPGFTVSGTVHSGAKARRHLEQHAVDLLLLDLYLPDGHGLQLVRTLRAAGHTADIIAVTSARDLAMVREGVSLGVVQYVLKPFTFATLRDRLTRYAEFRAATGEASGQDEVDRAIAALRAPRPAALPKGLTAPPCKP